MNSSKEIKIAAKTGKYEAKIMKKIILSGLIIASLLIVAWKISPPRKAEAIGTPTPLVEDTITVVSATGKVVPLQFAKLSAKTSGTIKSILVEENFTVAAGQVLVRLEESADQEAAVAAAEHELLAAEQALDALYKNAALAAAEAQQKVARARETLDDAEHKWIINQPGNRASPEEMKSAKAKVVVAEKRMGAARKKFERAGRKIDRAKAQIALTEAIDAYQYAVWYRDWLKKGADEIEMALFDAEVAIAEANLTVAEMEYEDVKDGPDPDKLKATEARLVNANAQLKAAKAAQKNLILKAPYNGTISEILIRPHEWITPGQPLLLIANLNHLEIETINLNELDIAYIQVGDPVRVTFDALPDAVVNGQVTRIAPKNLEGPGVNYRVIVELEEIPAGLRWGMTAFVDIVIDD